MRTAGDAYETPDGERGPHSGLPIPYGPGGYQVYTTDAAAGVDINIEPAWELYDASQTNRDVVVAVIDTGADILHPDLRDSIWVNGDEIPGDGIDNDGNGYADDCFGWDFFYGDPFVFSAQSSEDTHGTHVAGTIAAGRHNGGIAGITGSEHVKIMILKVLGTSQGIGAPEDVIAAIRYAEANGASICNLSFCSGVYSQELADTIQNSGMLFVVAAGNGDENGIGLNIDQIPAYPASLPFPNVITVSNLMFDGNLDTSSNFGPESADIAAPGSYIVSTIPGGYGVFERHLHVRPHGDRGGRPALLLPPGLHRPGRAGRPFRVSQGAHHPGRAGSHERHAGRGRRLSVGKREHRPLGVCSLIAKYFCSILQQHLHHRLLHLAAPPGLHLHLVGVLGEGDEHIPRLHGYYLLRSALQRDPVVRLVPVRLPHGGPVGDADALPPGDHQVDVQVLVVGLKGGLPGRFRLVAEAVDENPVPVHLISPRL